MAKISVSIILARKEFNEITSFKSEEMLKELKAVKFQLDSRFEIEGVGYVSVTDTKVPEWLSTLNTWCSTESQDALDEISKFLELRPISYSAAIFIRSDKCKRNFIICYGRGRKLINEDAIERNFGRNVALNLTSEDKIVSLRRQTYEGMPWYKESQASGVSEIHLFDINCEYEILKKVTSEIDIEIPLIFTRLEKEKRVRLIGDKTTGQDSLHLNVDINLKQILPLCSWAYEHYKSPRYKQIIKNIDSIQEVKDLAKLALLETELITQIASIETEKLKLIIPDLIDHETFNRFVLTLKEIHIEMGDYPEISKYIDAIYDKNLIPRSVDRLKKDKIIAYNGNSYIREWSVLKCLTTEVELHGEPYILMDGSWFQFEKEFLKKIVKKLNSKVIFNQNLSRWDGKTSEEDYNKDQAKKRGYACVDKKCASTNLGGKVEPCDLFKDDNHFIHVKKGTTSASLSHLFSQAYVSADLILKRDEKFINDFVSLNFEGAKISSVRSKLYAKKFNVTIAVLNQNMKPFNEGLKIRNLPIFSIINLNRVIEQIEKAQLNTQNIYIEFIDKISPVRKTKVIKKTKLT